jgi:3'-phosphoadenosine 5'-phosphosulfate sulfotransferase (PAPS reductase)/FAD synthetase
MTRADPFKIIEPTCISFSGGRTSAYMLWRVLQAHQMSLPPEAVVCFANTGKEEEATLRFVQDCSVNWNVPIVWLEWRDNDLGYEVVNFDAASRNGEPFRDMCIKKKALPNGFMRFCTKELKIDIVHQYLKDLGHGSADEPCSQMIGIRSDEQRRVAKMRGKSGADHKKNWIGDFLTPLANAGVVASMVGDFWESQSFNLDTPMVNGRSFHSNCDLCFHKPVAQILSLIQEKPSRATWWVDMEHHAKENFKPSVIHFSRDHPTYEQMAGYGDKQQDMFDQNEEAIACFCGD